MGFSGMVKITRKDARLQGLKYYFTGVECKHGHIAQRRVSNTLCLDCSTANNLKWRTENPEYESTWRKAQGNYEQIRKERDPEYYALVKSKWRIENRELDAQKTAEWRKNNPDKLKEHRAKFTVLYRKDMLQRIPPWADIKAIIEFYKNCPEGYEVDHIHPLRGKFISGLHVIDNLQYLPKDENRSKSNKFEPITTVVL